MKTRYGLTKFFLSITNVLVDWSIVEIKLSIVIQKFNLKLLTMADIFL